MNLRDLLQSLDTDLNPDYWADHVKLEVVDVLAAIDDRGWDELDAVWPNWSASWQIRMAEALTIVEYPRATSLLVRMIGVPEPDVGYVIAEALLERNYNWSPTVSLRADLQRHLAAASSGQQAIFQRLLNRLPS